MGGMELRTLLWSSKFMAFLNSGMLHWSTSYYQPNIVHKGIQKHHNQSRYAVVESPVLYWTKTPTG